MRLLFTERDTAIAISAFCKSNDGDGFLSCGVFIAHLEEPHKDRNDQRVFVQVSHLLSRLLHFGNNDNNSVPVVLIKPLVFIVPVVFMYRIPFPFTNIAEKAFLSSVACGHVADSSASIFPAWCYYNKSSS